MTLWNVLVPVVELVEANTRDTAIDELKARLRSYGFDPYEGEGTDAFRSEEV